jgi:hypothetical protein
MKKKKVETFLDKMTPQNKAIAEYILEELAFMQKTLKTLKLLIDDNGAVDMTSGKPRESPIVRSYNQTVKNYSNMLAQLEKILKKTVDEKAENTKEINGEEALQEWLDAQK